MKADYQIPEKKRLSKEEAETIVSESKNPFTVTKIETKESKRQPKPAFITSTLQQDAINNLSMSASRTMMVAQKLYEGIEIGGEIIGLITYMRTDANRLAEPFIQETQSYIEKEFGKSYLGKYRVTTKDNAQDAHEAIRPTSIHRTPDMMQDYLSKDELKLYKRIYERTVASLMSPAIFDVTKVTFESNGHIYQASGEIEKFKGFQAIYTESKHKDKILPHLTEGQTIDAKEVNPIEKVTTPPTRYSEATLIKDLESLGIGRPSTYASILQTLKARDYVELVEKRFKPTDQGKLTSEQLDEFFHKIINVEYTSKMETVLDEIAEGKKNGGVLIDQFYKSFIPLVDHAQKHMKKIGPKLTDELCPMCGKPLVVRMSKYGEFIACSGFPKCKYVKKTTE